MMKHFNPEIKSISKQSAFTLLEVLITLVILAIGLLGLAGLQATSLQNNHSAYHRSQATIIAYDMIDRMRANQAAIDNYLTTFMAPTAAAIQNGCITGGCSTAQMAQNDLFEWNATLVAAFPSGSGTISVGATPGTYLIRVIWLDDRKNNANTQFDVSFLP